MKLLSIRLSLDKRGWTKTKEELEVKESDKSYSTYDKRILKSKLMVPHTILLESHKWFRYTTYCLPKDEEKAFLKLRECIIKQIDRIDEEFDLILLNYNTDINDIPLKFKQD